MYGNFAVVFNFNRLYLKLNRFICNRRFSPIVDRFLSPIEVPWNLIQARPKRNTNKACAMYSMWALCGHLSCGMDIQVTVDWVFVAYVAR